MNLDNASSIITQAINLTIMASMPSVGLGLLIGLIISIIQAVTQIQEQTLTFVPKMIIVFLVVAATFPWMYNMLMDFSLYLWGNIPLYAK